ncbi:hypothetical protein LA345_13310 [Burkholderia vietnamiensis]|uniref:Uncharacterized protein n=1 Tax=Burkholderia vietnamiensis (strain G4 / LMG 22486) TaxID=269482 RepID=A4JFT3_BURVG|nr:hypothetical protein Bcep1808_2134 [Burkholderia vietnamiensis G4]MCB4344892.1 hypothetical protein [Burkholderia vietnamiensis]
MPLNAMSTAFFEAYAKLPVASAAANPAKHPEREAERQAGAAPASCLRTEGHINGHRNESSTVKLMPAIAPAAPHENLATDSLSPAIETSSDDAAAPRRFGKKPRVERDEATIVELINAGATLNDLAELLEIKPGSVKSNVLTKSKHPAAWAAWRAKNPIARSRVSESESKQPNDSPEPSPELDSSAASVEPPPPPAALPAAPAPRDVAPHEQVITVGVEGASQIVIRYIEGKARTVDLLRAARMLELMAEEANEADHVEGVSQ